MKGIKKKCCNDIVKNFVDDFIHVIKDLEVKDLYGFLTVNSL
jgi:hypothetical protein